MSTPEEKQALRLLELEHIADTAADHGCRVTWDDAYGFPMPFCGCGDELHYIGQQSSLISRESAKRVRVH